jgi:hypothetical protein
MDSRGKFETHMPFVTNQQTFPGQLLLPGFPSSVMKLKNSITYSVDYIIMVKS